MITEKRKVILPNYNIKYSFHFIYVIINANNKTWTIIEFTIIDLTLFLVRDETSDTDSVSSVAPLAEREQKGTWKKMEEK